MILENMTNFVNTEVRNATITAKYNATSGLTDLFQEGLKGIYFAEKALTNSLPIMLNNATSLNLIDAVTINLLQAEDQIVRLNRIFKLGGNLAEAKKCDVIVGLIADSEKIIDKAENGVVRDAAIVIANQKIKHYEIASYNALLQIAVTLQLDKIAHILEEILDEEKDAYILLSDIYFKSLQA